MVGSEISEKDMACYKHDSNIAEGKKLFRKPMKTAGKKIYFYDRTVEIGKKKNLTACVK